MNYDDLMDSLDDVRKYAKDNYVPIIRSQSAKFLYDYIKDNNIKTVLEIGTAIGYSGVVMLSAGVERLTTVDINKDYLKLATELFGKLSYSDKVEIICGDAKYVLKNLVGCGKKYDMIFLDGAKGQYIRYLPDLIKLIGHQGVIFADNIFLGGLVESKEVIPAKKRAMVNNLRLYNARILQDDFDTQVVRLEDGIAISKYKGEL